MSLLIELTTNTVEQGYRDAAVRRASTAPEERVHDIRRGARTVWLGAGVLVAAGALFATSAVAAHRGAAQAARDRAILIKQINGLTTTVDERQAHLTTLQDAVKRARDNALAATNAGTALQTELDQLELLDGDTPVEGPGVQVKLDNAKDADSSSTSLGTIFDRDVQAVVDALFASGAEAIAVNGQRLTAQSAIREAGDAILVDFRPLSPPYVIDAVGPPTLDSKFLGTETAVLYENWRQVYGLGFSVDQVARLTLPSSTNPVVHYAQPLESP
jgi:uncharacterized protein YlxW (UPF0749 family)